MAGVIGLVIFFGGLIVMIVGCDMEVMAEESGQLGGEKHRKGTRLVQLGGWMVVLSSPVIAYALFPFLSGC